MNSVGDVSDGHFFQWPVRKKRSKEVPAHLAMQTAHTIHCSASADCEIRHIECFRRIVRVKAAQSQQIVKCDAELLLCIATEILFDECRRKTVKTSSHRRVSS